jgi:hypothetical protein
MAGVLAAYGLIRWNVPSLVVAAGIVLCWVIASGWQLYLALRALIAGLDYLVLSVVLFLLAIGVSLAKAGYLSRLLSRRKADAAPFQE